MKITFTKLVTAKPQVEVKADKYKSVYYDVNTAKTNGIVLNPTIYTSLDTISIGSPRLKLSATAAQKTAFLELIANASYTEVSVNDLYNYLASKADNTPNTPYKIKITDAPYEIEGAYDSNDFYSGSIQYALLSGNNSSKYVDLVLTDTAKIIGDYAFCHCANITSIIIPTSTGSTTIGNYAFFGCSSLTSITIPNCITGIGENAFSDCTELTSVTIPDSVTEFEGFAFYNCSSLTSLTIPRWTTLIEQGSFVIAENGTISYNGTVDEFKEIEGYEDVISYYSVTCTDGIIDKL